MSSMPRIALAGACCAMGKHGRDFEFPLAGEYNVLNATAAAALAANYGIGKKRSPQRCRNFAA